MAGVALLIPGSSGFKIADAIIPEPRLRMGLVATNTDILIRISDLFASMESRFKVIRDVIVAGETLLLVKEIAPLLVDNVRVGMKIPFSHISVTIHAWGLPVGRNMKFSGINQP